MMPTWCYPFPLYIYPYNVQNGHFHLLIQHNTETFGSHSQWYDDCPRCFYSQSNNSRLLLPRSQIFERSDRTIGIQRLHLLINKQSLNYFFWFNSFIICLCFSSHSLIPERMYVCCCCLNLSQLSLSISNSIALISS